MARTANWWKRVVRHLATAWWPAIGVVVLLLIMAASKFINPFSICFRCNIEHIVILSLVLLLCVSTFQIGVVFAVADFRAFIARLLAQIALVVGMIAVTFQGEWTTLFYPPVSIYPVEQTWEYSDFDTFTAEWVPRDTQEALDTVIVTAGQPRASRNQPLRVATTGECGVYVCDCYVELTVPATVWLRTNLMHYGKYDYLNIAFEPPLVGKRNEVLLDSVDPGTYRCTRLMTVGASPGRCGSTVQISLQYFDKDAGEIVTVASKVYNLMDGGS